MANNNRYNAQQPAQPKSKTFLAVVATVLVFAIAAVALVGVYSKGFADWTKFKLSDNDPIVEVPEGVSEADNLDFKFSNSSKVRLATTATAANAEGFLTKKLIATVLPADAYNKAVDWSVLWQTPESEFATGKTATDYITAVPNEDGSNVAMVTCLKGFLGEKIIVRVTTRDGNFTADCIVTYVGIPTSLTVDTTGLDITHDDGWDVDIINLKMLTDYKIALNFDNIYGVVNPSIIPNYNIKVDSFGKFQYIGWIKHGDITINSIGNGNNYMKITDAIELPLSNTYYDDAGVAFGSISLDVYCPEYKTENNILSILTKKSLTDDDDLYDFKIPKIVSNRNFDVALDNKVILGFTRYEDPLRVIYFQMKITETVTGLSNTINYRVSKASGISINHPSIEF